MQKSFIKAAGSESCVVAGEVYEGLTHRNK